MIYYYSAGGLEPLQGCKVLRELDLSDNFLTGGVEVLQSCTTLQDELCNLSHNQLTSGQKLSTGRFKALLRRVGALTRL